MTENQFSKRKRFKNISVTMDEEVLKEIEIFKKEFKTLKRTEIMRFAIEYAILIRRKEFMEQLKQLDG